MNELTHCHYKCWKCGRGIHSECEDPHCHNQCKDNSCLNPIHLDTFKGYKVDLE